MKRLNKQDVIVIHDEQLRLYGGESGILEDGLLDFLCNAPFMTFDGIDLYPDIYDKAAKYLHGFACSQVFVDGNKRTGVACMLAMLYINGIDVDATGNDIITLGYDVANNKMDVDDIAIWIMQHIKM